MTPRPEAGAGLHVLMIGFAVPDDTLLSVCRVDRYMPVQTHKLSWSVIRGLEANGCRVDLISSLPISTFPSGRKAFVKLSRPVRPNGSEWVLLPFINVLVLKHLTRFVSCFWFTTRWLISTAYTGRKVILLYGTNSAHMYAALLATRLFRVPVVTLVSDPPSVALPGEGSFVRSIRHADVWLLKRGLRAMDGVISLTRQLAEVFAPSVPAIVVEGVLSSQDVARFVALPQLKPQGTGGMADFTVLYAGGIEASYGVALLLEAFSRLEGAHCRLWVCGKGHLAVDVERAAREDPRITYWGFLPQEEVLAKVSQATVLVNARPSHQSFTEFSFPSKTLEYMASGRPTITTRLPGIPHEYFPYLHGLEDETPAGLATLLAVLRDTPQEELDRFGDRARAFVTETKNEESQGSRIRHFIEHVLSMDGITASTVSATTMESGTRTAPVIDADVCGTTEGR